ncbi:MAG: glycosyltransferase family 2 protein [Lachnospiraceae bacterium]|nr:glycosyltransferase family 2 protein [Lachnospiraceae bacterium]
MRTNVNVVIPAYKPDEKLIKIFKMMETQTARVSKIIVMNTCQDAKNCERVDSDEVTKLCDKSGYKIDKDFIEIHNIRKEDFDHGATRNAGASHVSDDCDYVLFMTQDAVPENDKLIENLLKPFSDESNGNKIGVAYGRQLATDSSSLAEKFTRGFNYPDEDRIKTVDDIGTIGIKAFFCSNVCALYRREVLNELGGFVNKAIFNEDMVFANKLLKSGYNIAYASKATVIHTHEYSGMQQFKRNFDLAVSQKMNPQAFEGISSESEGVKYVIAAFKYFCKNKRPFTIIPFGINCVYKYLGYRKGKNYERLSKGQIMKYTSNKAFFEKI